LKILSQHRLKIEGPNRTIDVTDIVDRETRSKIMGAVRTENTGPELSVRRFLHRRGFRYRLHDKRLPGTPDIVLPSYKTAIFVHGCFWHRHAGCKKATTPKSNSAYWEKKFRENIERDDRKKKELEEAGWRVIIVWQCQTDPVGLEILEKTIRTKNC
jgi:DNA mismatch endonuclease (patch repair protein)